MFSCKENDKFIELKELSKKIKSKDIRTTIKWCSKKGIPIIGKKQKLTYRFLVDMELDREIVKFLKQHYPKSWQEMYQFYRNYDILGYINALPKE